MDKKIQQGLSWLEKEMKKDSNEIAHHKQKAIEEIKQLDKTKMFQPKPKKKVSILRKILMIFGYGKNW